MTYEALKENLKHMEEMTREMYIFGNQLKIIEDLEKDRQIVIDSEEKKLLKDAVIALKNQLRILNNSIPELVTNIGFYKRIVSEEKPKTKKTEQKLIQVRYTPPDIKEKISLTISDKDKEEFLENLSKSNLSVNQLKRKYSAEKYPEIRFGKPNFYAKLSNKFFRNFSNSLIEKGYFVNLNKDLRKMNSPFILGTYVSMVFFSVFITLVLSIMLVVFLIFFNLSFLFPFISSVSAEESILSRLLKFFWLIIIMPLGTGILMYFYPASEGKSLGSKINQELPFVTIHMSAIATSGIEPLTIFKIILKNENYYYTNMEFRKIINFVNFHGKDLVTALRDAAKTSPSSKLKDLLDGLATSITSGGSLKQFLTKHAENMLFDYKLEREKYTKVSETFMDIYISIVIAAPMILLILFVIMGSTGTLDTLFGLSTSIINLLIILIIILLNIGFLMFLKIKQPVI